MLVIPNELETENEDDKVSISAPPISPLSINGTFSDGSERSECNEHNHEDEDTQQLQTCSDISDQLQTTSSVTSTQQNLHLQNWHQLAGEVISWLVIILTEMCEHHTKEWTT